MTGKETDEAMNGIWVFAEHSAGALERVTFELLGEARRLAKETTAEVTAVIFGERVGALTAPLAHYGADAVYVFEDERLRYYDPGLVGASLGRLCAAEQPVLVLFPATSTGSDVAVRLATEHDWPLMAGCVNFHIRDDEIEAVRPLADHKVHAFVRAARPGPRLATVVPDVIGVDRPDTSRSARVLQGEIVIPEQTAVEVRGFIPGDPRTLDLSEAEIVVSAGRGLGCKENMRFVQEFAAALGGSVGGTRVVVDLGWLPRERQVGQTGKTVTPRLYVACGISGATQHTIGMKDSATIIAINTDPGAPIFKVADLALEADVTELLPVLTQRCREERGGS